MGIDQVTVLFLFSYLCRRLTVILDSIIFIEHDCELSNAFLRPQPTKEVSEHNSNPVLKADEDGKYSILSAAIISASLTPYA